jgi:predicted enzyme related to lactoylglutathione lyase
MADLGFTGKLVCSIPVKDHKTSAKWYADMLGCEVVFENDELGMSYMSSPLPNVWLDLSQVEKVQNGGPSIVWGVSDADAARAEIEGRGVKFDGPNRSFGGMVRLSTFFDPDGNTLMFYENLS